MRSILTFVLISVSVLFAEKQAVLEQYLTVPKSSINGIIFSDHLTGGLFRAIDNSVIQISDRPGSGIYFTLSTDKTLVGFKEIDDQGKQQPVVYDVKNNSKTILHSGSFCVGQVSFSNDGTIAFTIEQELFILNGSSTRRFNLGTYSNLAPISPNGIFAAFNDNSDQLWIINLETLRKTRITDTNGSYAFPQWSPDGSQILYSHLNGNLFVYSIATQISVALGEGDSPSWINNSTIVFSQKKIEQQQLVSADLFSITSDGLEKKQLTTTADNFEIDPCYDIITHFLIYADSKRGGIFSRSLSGEPQLDQEHQILSYDNLLTQKTLLTTYATPASPTTVAAVSFEMPYVHQRWDTPDLFNGSAACGATSAIMVIAYYNIVPKWNVWCSASSFTPAHYSPYGNYVCEIYSYREFSYSLSANDPNGKPSYGGYGFMWNGSDHPYSSMVDYYTNHGLSATLYDSNATFFETVISNVDSGYPFTLCNGLTDAGHIIVVNGYDANNRTLIVNDPYGNKNSGSYPSATGKGVKYDWVGYNNGFKNLNRIYWGVSVKYSDVSKADSLVDDTQLDKGFYLHTTAPSSMTKWADKKTGGYNNHYWWTRTKLSDTCFATWTATLDSSGLYEVFAYIPISEATAAKYKVLAADGNHEVIANQKNIKNDWLSLGTFIFEKGNSASVRLGDGSDTVKQAIVFDAVRWNYRGAQPLVVAVEQTAPNYFLLEQNYPNPFNPLTMIRYQLPATNHVSLKVYDVLGKEIATLVDEQQESGTYQTAFNAKALSSGMYFYKLTAGAFSKVKKMSLQK